METYTAALPVQSWSEDQLAVWAYRSVLISCKDDASSYAPVGGTRQRVDVILFDSLRFEAGEKKGAPMKGPRSRRNLLGETSFSSWTNRDCRSGARLQLGSIESPAYCLSLQTFLVLPVLVGALALPKSEFG